MPDITQTNSGADQVPHSSRPDFTVITVCFNAEATIAQTLASVKQQYGVSIEHIVVDGGSTDGTLDILSNHDDQLAFWISEPDNGVYDAMQKGLGHATGHFTGCLNADDYFANENVLAKLLNSAKPDQVSGLLGAVEQIDEQSNIKRRIGDKPFQTKDLEWGIFPPHPAMYLRTDLMKQSGGFDKSFRLVGDMDLFNRVLQNTDLPLHHVDETIVKMRLGGLSTSGLKSYREVGQEMLRILRSNGQNVFPAKIWLRGFRKLSQLQSWPFQLKR